MNNWLVEKTKKFITRLYKMFKNVKFFNNSKNTWLMIFIVAILGIALYFYSSKKSKTVDTMEDGSNGQPQQTQTQQPQQPQSQNAGEVPKYSAVADPSELLPKDENSEFANLNPGNLPTPDLLQAGYHIGINTIGQTMKNPSLDLRSEPVIEKQNVGIWNISTIEPDYVKAPLEIGNR